MSGHEKHNYEESLEGIYWRDEILQVMYWMSGEGLGKEFALSDLQKFLQAEESLLIDNLEGMVASGMLERAGANKYALTILGQQEGGRRFADEFESMLKPGHFECDDPNCDCNDPESTEPCKHLSPAGAAHQHS
ncbi:MAG: hypothetical protein ACR2LC_03830 [Pyrinomonadaceae bacterium]